MNYNTLTLTFEIKDKEKFREFHSKVFPSSSENEKSVIKEIGARVIISSWSNPHEENEKLEAAIEYAMDFLFYENREILELILEGKSRYDAEKEVLT